MEESQIIERIRKEVDRAGGLRQLAKEWGVSAPYLCDLTKNRRSPGPAILKHLGLRKVHTIHYEPTPSGR